ncbi:MAG TPA: hypothetical protein VJ867_04800, partial [Gemmatimonadaceae bacterium]|nr:hypothetical protein [Gemmatimonadaceae bacterium]
KELGTTHALVVHGTGMDEISPLATTRVIEIHGGKIGEWVIDPTKFGYSGLAAEDLAGGSPKQNADTVMAVLSGESNKATRGAVVLNAGAALYVGGRAKKFDEGVALAEAALDNGEGIRALERLRAAYLS